eukprot:4752434-Pyramimonas_sp.AAC.1
MVVYRGKQSSRHYARLKCGNQRCFKFPEFDISLHVVDEYKHLGCVVTPDGRLKRDADHKISQTMSAYVPISRKVFGATELCQSV